MNQLRLSIVSLLTFQLLIVSLKTDAKPCGIRWNKCPKWKKRVVRQIQDYEDTKFDDIITSIEDEMEDETIIRQELIMPWKTSS